MLNDKIPTCKIYMAIRKPLPQAETFSSYNMTAMHPNFIVGKTIV